VRFPDEWFDKLTTFAYFGALGAFAALIGYLVQVSKKGAVPISFTMLVITMLVGCYLGVLFSQLLPSDWSNRDAVVLLIGATGVKGFEIVSKTVREVIPDVIRKMMGGPPGPPQP